MEKASKALWLKTGDRFRFPEKQNSYYVQSVKPYTGTKMLVYITGSKAKCFAMDINKPIVKIIS